MEFRKKMIVVALTGAAWSSSALAGFAYDPPVKQAAASVPATTAATRAIVEEKPILTGLIEIKPPVLTVTEHGVPQPSACSGFSNGLPIRDGLAILLPPNWRVYGKRGVDMGVPASWRCASGETWTDALRAVLRQAGLVGDVWWPERKLILSQRPAELQDEGVTPTSVDASQAPVAKSASTGPSLAAQSRWTLKAGETISAGLMAWAAMSGWHVVWSVPEDWSVPSNSVFFGDFKTAAGQVVKSLADNGAQIRGAFYDGNRTLVIRGNGAGGEQ